MIRPDNGPTHAHPATPYRPNVGSSDARIAVMLQHPTTATTAASRIKTVRTGTRPIKSVSSLTGAPIWLMASGQHTPSWSSWSWTRLLIRWHATLGAALSGFLFALHSFDREPKVRRQLRRLQRITQRTPNLFAVLGSDPAIAVALGAHVVFVHALGSMRPFSVAPESWCSSPRPKHRVQTPRTILRLPGRFRRARALVATESRRRNRR